MVCIECKYPMANRKNKKFCSDVCRANYHTYMKRLKSKRDKTLTLVINSLPAENELVTLYNKIYGKG